jgi:hypothetical protein
MSFQKLLVLEKYGLLGCKSVYFDEIPTFRKNIQPPSSEPKSKLSKKTNHLLLLAFFDAENGCVFTRRSTDKNNF